MEVSLAELLCRIEVLFVTLLYCYYMSYSKSIFTFHCHNGLYNLQLGWHQVSAAVHRVLFPLEEGLH